MPVRTFSELPYVRPNLDTLKTSYDEIHHQLIHASSAPEAIDAVRAWNAVRVDVSTMNSLAEVHFSQNVTNEVAKAEKLWFDEHGPSIVDLDQQFVHALIASPWKTDIGSEFGKLFITRLEDSMRTFRPEIMDLLVKESELSRQYNELTASAKIEVDGATYNLSSIGKLLIDLDRGVRLRAHAAMYGFLSENATAMDRIYHELVQLRTEMAHALGFPSYTELRYVEYGRVDYNAGDVERFRAQVREIVVPLVKTLRAAQQRRLGLDALTIADEKVQFPDGNPVAEGDHDWIVAKAASMYNELSSETAEFFSLMLEGDLLDLKTRDNKATGGYCTSFPKYGVPFIFANFNRTTHDVEVLTHEAGHAFQAYRSRNHAVPEYLWPTMEACEIHSMGMEFLTWPWMKDFFGEQTDKFRFYHLQAAILFMPYGCAVDHFQHWVYANPTATPAERNAMWKQMEATYMPWRDASGMGAAEEGRTWQFQRHIYESPFYYIDYALAQTCALQYWKWAEHDRTAAFASYLKICDVGGSQSFLDIVASGGLMSPFSEGCLEDIVKYAYAWLDASNPQFLPIAS
jgi:M3 family oligoendopeptidase